MFPFRVFDQERKKETEDLKGNKAHPNVALAERHHSRRNKVSNEHPNGADDDVAEPMCGVDLDHDGGGIFPEKLLIHLENKFVIPRGIVVPLCIHARGELPGRVDPGPGVGAHLLGNGLQILRGDDVYFQELERSGPRRHLLRR